MEVYASDFAVLGKPDASPLTEADLRAEALITPALQALLPGVPVVAEEAHARGECGEAAGQGGAAFCLVDPLDGTREFVARNGEFTVNITLVRDGEPVLGVVYAPALGRHSGPAAALRQARVREPPLHCAWPRLTQQAPAGKTGTAGAGSDS